MVMWWTEVNVWLWIVNYPWTDSNIYWAEVIILAAEICFIAHVEMLDGLEYLPQDINCWFLQVGYLAVLVPLCCNFLKDMNVKTQRTNILSLCQFKLKLILNWGESRDMIWILSGSIAAPWSLLRSSISSVYILILAESATGEHVHISKNMASGEFFVWRSKFGYSIRRD